MKNIRIILPVLVLLFISLTLQFGCGRSQSSQFYVMTSTVENDGASSAADNLKDISIGIGPVELSDYMLRPQILTYERAGKLNYAELERWAEPLDDNFARVIAQNLSLLIPTEQIFIFPYRGSAKVKYQIVFEVLRFAKGADGQVTLVVLWSIYDEQELKLLTRKKSTYQRPGPTGEETYYEQLSTTMSQLLEDLSRDLSSQLLKISK
jgi:uncharacterized lipoprotein YmbA